MSVARFTFGPRLKAHRERKGITLQDIAESTKIGISLLTALERNDIAQWPKGIFRRAFLKSYTRAIDIPFESTWAEFTQLFPEEGAPIAARPVNDTPFRLTLALPRARPVKLSARNAVAASIDVVLVLLTGLLITAIFGISAWASIAVVSVLYSAVSTLLVGGSVARRYLRARYAHHDAIPADHDFVIAETADAVPEQTAPVLERPRIFAVPSAHNPVSAEPRERRVADR